MLVSHAAYLIDVYCRLPTIQQEVQQRKLLYMGLYLLIWGEAANLRFMPECLCYIYHHVSFVIEAQEYFYIYLTFKFVCPYGFWHLPTL